MSTTSTTKPAAARSRAKKPAGTVAFVATGPGDPELLTVRAVRLLAEAEVIVVDADVADLLAPHVSEQTEVIAAVDDEGLPLPHAKRARLVVDAARSGRRVVRVLAGDPVIDGSLAVEAAAVAKARLTFEVAPGVSLLSGVAAYAGAGLVGGKAREVRVIDLDDPSVDWSAHTNPRVTLVVLGAADRATELARLLLAAGRSGRTPVAVTRGVTTVEQRTVASTLTDLAAAVKVAKHAGPGVVVVGEAVAQRSALSWFETKPLFGWRVLVPRTKEQAASLSDQLARYGAVPHEVPTISVEPPRTPQQMERAVKGLVTGRYEWIAFTSRQRREGGAGEVRGVRPGRPRVRRASRWPRSASRPPQALVAFGVRPDLVPERGAVGGRPAGGLAAVRPGASTRSTGCSCRAPTSRPRPSSPGSSSWAGRSTTSPPTGPSAPRRRPPRPGRRSRAAASTRCCSPRRSTVRNLVGIAGKPHDVTVIACIGPATAKTAEEHGLRVDVMAPKPSVQALAEALAATVTRCGWPPPRPASPAGGPADAGRRRGARRPDRRTDLT